MICKTCGKEIYDQAVICPGCGCPTGNYPVASTPANSTYDPQTGVVPSSPIVVRYLKEARLIHTLSILSFVFLFITVIGYPILALIARKRAKELPLVKESDLKNEQDIFDYRLAQKKLKNAKTMRRVAFWIFMSAIIVAILILAYFFLYVYVLEDLF